LFLKLAAIKHSDVPA